MVTLDVAHNMKIEKSIEYLTRELQNALSKEFLNFEQTKQISDFGIYLIFQNEKVIYVGKTNRSGKTRLRELASDYRSHTLNKKILQILLSKVLKVEFPPLKKETKRQLIDDGILSEEQFKNLQSKVNKLIKSDLRFKFYPTKLDEIIQIEHFAIAVLNPKMND